MMFNDFLIRRGKWFGVALAFWMVLLCLALGRGSAIAGTNPGQECVILLHGLARTSKSMFEMQETLEEKGYTVFNIDYPSRKFSIETLSQDVISRAVLRAQAMAPHKIHFVTHSLGGILVRYYLSSFKIENLGRVVMLSPPNQGSEVVDKISDWPGFDWLNGPAGQQLGTTDEGVPAQLGKVDFELGIITGDRTINFFLSMMIPGDDDGKVSIESAKVEGMADFLVVHHTHPYIMEADDVIHQAQYFLQNGKFDIKTLPPQ